MNETKFWEIIETAAIRSDEDFDELISIIENDLLLLSKEEVIDFECILRKKIIEADHFNVMMAQRIIDGHVNDDIYLNFRCWLITLGKDIFENAIKDPDYLSDYVNTDTFPDFEDLLYVAGNVFSKITGNEEDESIPRNFALEKGLDYDLGAPPTKGEDWTEEELPIKCPKLWNLFN